MLFSLTHAIFVSPFFFNAFVNFTDSLTLRFLFLSASFSLSLYACLFSISFCLLSGPNNTDHLLNKQHQHMKIKHSSVMRIYEEMEATTMAATTKKFHPNNTSKLFGTQAKQSSRSRSERISALKFYQRQ